MSSLTAVSLILLGLVLLTLVLLTVRRWDTARRRGETLGGLNRQALGDLRGRVATRRAAERRPHGHPSVWL